MCVTRDTNEIQRKKEGKRKNESPCTAARSSYFFQCERKPPKVGFTRARARAVPIRGDDLSGGAHYFSVRRLRARRVIPL